MATIFWTGKLTPIVKIMVNFNSLLAFLGGKTRNTSAMKHRIKLGYSDTISEHVQNYDTVGLMHYHSIANVLLDGISVMDKTVLDVGCGTGAISFCTLERGAVKILGTDLSRTMVMACQKKVADIGLDDKLMEFKQCDAENLTIEDNSFDVILSSAVLGFLPNQLKAVKEMVRVVKPGGIVAIAVHGPRHYWEACNAALKSVGKRHMIGYRIEFWPRKETYVKKLLVKAGLQNLRTGHYVRQEEMEDAGKVFDFFAGSSGMWWYSKFPPHKRARDVARMREYFKRKNVNVITSDIVLAYGRKPQFATEKA